MTRLFKSVITVIVAFAMVFTFIPFLGNSQAYAATGQDLGTFVMDLSEDSIYFCYGTYEDWDDENDEPLIHYDEEELKMMEALDNTLDYAGGNITTEDGIYIYYDVDKDGTKDVEYEIAFGEVSEDHIYTKCEGSSLLRPRVVKLSAATKEKLAKAGKNYFSTVKFIIYPASQTFSINNAKVQSVAARTYSGSAWKPLPTVTVKGYKLKSDDYTVTYSNNVSVGTAKITFKGKGVFTGSVSKTFKINPKGTTLTTPSKGRTYITVKWNKQATKMKNYPIKGYQVYFATNSTFTKGLKKYLVSPYTVTSKKITGLTPGKTYYFKVRTYKVVNKVYYYSTWSAYKKVTTNR